MLVDLKRDFFTFIMNIVEIYSIREKRKITPIIFFKEELQEA